VGFAHNIVVLVHAITLHVMLLHVSNVIVLHATLSQKLDVIVFERFSLLPFKILPFQPLLDPLPLHVCP
jgi:uncharacterized protein YhhL (DUF1145 family)